MKSMMTVVTVGIADLNVVEAPNKIRTSGLGSCVGVVIYDQFKNVDTAIDSLIDRLGRMRARKSKVKAKIAVGAQMFQFQSSSEMMRIGPRNVDAVKERLKQHRIPIISSDTGGNKGRTIEFD